MNSDQSVSIISFPQVLTITFIVLKLCGVIAWSWWWVLAPLWIPVAAVLAFLVAAVVFALISKK